MYTVYTAIGYLNHKGQRDYEWMTGIPVPTKNIKDIKASMFLMEFEIYRIEKGNETVYESARLLEIMQRRFEKRAGK